MVFELNDKVMYWLDLVEYDIETAKAMLRSSRYLYVGFMCHQAVEKALKAVVAKDCAPHEFPQKTHDLNKLAVQANLFDKMSEAQKDFIEYLRPMNIEARYPECKESALETLSDRQCAKTIKETEDFVCWIRTKL